MKLVIAAILDSKAQSYMVPFFTENHQTAVRMFAGAANSDGMIGKHPEDFHLYIIGEFDQDTADIKTLTARVNLGCAIQYVKEPRLIEFPPREQH